jgi:hypothetical protein
MDIGVVGRGDSTLNQRRRSLTRFDGENWASPSSNAAVLTARAFVDSKATISLKRGPTKKRNEACEETGVATAATEKGRIVTANFAGDPSERSRHL